MDTLKLANLGFPELLELSESLCPSGAFNIHTAGQHLLTILGLPAKTINQGLESHQTLSSLLINPSSTTSVPVILGRMDEDTCT